MDTKKKFEIAQPWGGAICIVQTKMAAFVTMTTDGRAHYLVDSLAFFSANQKNDKRFSIILAWMFPV